VPRFYFKRDELNHTGSHKINNCLGQILLAQAHGARRAIIAETGRRAQHGRGGGHRLRQIQTCRARSSWAPFDVERQKPNVFRMKLLGAKVNGRHVRWRPPRLKGRP